MNIFKGSSVIANKNNSTRNENRPVEQVLNIRTAKDINIYNNSFILSAAAPTVGAGKQKKAVNRMKSQSNTRNRPV